MILAPTFVALIAAHKFGAAITAWLIYSAIVDGMPAPDQNSGIAYRWLHASLNIFAGNVFRTLIALFPRLAAVLQKPQNEA